MHCKKWGVGVTPLGVLGLMFRFDTPWGVTKGATATLLIRGADATPKWVLSLYGYIVACIHF
jgi:hypothetical protein